MKNKFYLGLLVGTLILNRNPTNSTIQKYLITLLHYV